MFVPPTFQFTEKKSANLKNFKIDPDINSSKVLQLKICDEHNKMQAN